MAAKLSIIVPLYNKEKFIAKCLDSILVQADKNIDLIVVNDGSSDRSRAIVEEYQKKFIFLNLIDKKNEGLPAARNTGLEHAKGDYILHIDSDDWIEDGYIQSIQKEIIENPDVDVFVYDYIKDDGFNTSYVSTWLNNEKVSDNREYLKALCLNQAQVSAWSKVVRKKIYDENDIKFLEGTTIGEDLSATIPLINNANLIKKVNKAFLHYMQDTGGMTKAIYNERHLESIHNSVMHVRYLLGKSVNDASLLDTLYINHVGMYFLFTSKSRTIFNNRIERELISVIKRSSTYHSSILSFNFKYILCKHLPYKLGYKIIRVLVGSNV
ncbi:glycosyltransferase family 2 protein [Vibrio parahaemolyticus]|nr:glycosyltransferase family 2 protein [Vibrio parahaemolyticus]